MDNSIPGVMPRDFLLYGLPTQPGFYFCLTTTHYGSRKSNFNTRHSERSEESLDFKPEISNADFIYVGLQK
ncbi:MAG: hypothetical protein ACI9JN_000595 [Bacteroidia bacterium]|jgi:hypothetical protein